MTIGKNLVKTILSNNGYRVIDLGKQVAGGDDHLQSRRREGGLRLG